jgi:hypothetical protein
VEHAPQAPSKKTMPAALLILASVISVMTEIMRQIKNRR